jgi:hypothetical protein
VTLACFPALTSLIVSVNPGTNSIKRFEAYFCQFPQIYNKNTYEVAKTAQQCVEDLTPLRELNPRNSSFF